MTWITTTIALEELDKYPNGKAWNQLSETCLPMLVKFGIKLGLRYQQSEDAAQETMVKFMELYKAGKFQRGKGGGLRKWLFGISYNVIRDLVKKLPREKLIADTTTGTTFWDSLEDENAIEKTYDMEWEKMVLAKSLEDIRRRYPKDEYEAFVLYALREKSASEVAKQFDKTENAIYILKHKIIKEIRSLTADSERI